MNHLFSFLRRSAKSRGTCSSFLSLCPRSIRCSAETDVQSTRSSAFLHSLLARLMIVYRNSVWGDDRLRNDSFGKSCSRTWRISSDTRGTLIWRRLKEKATRLETRCARLLQSEWFRECFQCQWTHPVQSDRPENCGKIDRRQIFRRYWMSLLVS